MENFLIFVPMIWLQVILGGGEESPAVKEVTLWDLVLLGGWAMIPLVLLFAIAIYIFIERYQVIRKANADPTPLMNRVKELVRRGEVKEALLYCESVNSPFARILAKGLSRLGSPLQDIASAIENEAKLELNRLESSLAYLATVAGAAPMVGFLGTVTGMIQAFMKISQFQGNVDPTVLADGIYQAMITTAAGLIVSIPAYLGYNILANMISNVIHKMEVTSTEFIDLLQEPVRHSE